MAAIDDPKTLGPARLSFADEAEIDEFAATLAKFERGELTSDQWRAFRLVRGTYGQRQDDVQMVRVKIPQGILDGAQLRALADVADEWSRGFGHLTTRQNLQLHFVPRAGVEPLMRRIAEAGLTTREACGSAVRNVTACPYAGVSEDEAFDVTPYAEALTRYFLRHELSSSLPRKFKIAFEGCARADHALTAINDIGFRASVRPGRGRPGRGFRVTAGGGTSTVATSGGLLYEFLPAGEILNVAEAILRVFHRLGDYQHKQRNRMKFLIKELGWDGWRAEFERELERVQAEGGAALPFDPEDAPEEQAPSRSRSAPAPSVEKVAARAAAAVVRGPGLVPEPPPGFTQAPAPHPRWAATNVRPQRQPEYSVVTVTLLLGDLTSSQMRILADLAAAYGDGTVRATPQQDFMLRWVHWTDVPELYRRLDAAGLGRPDAETIADVTSCPGAESCRLAVTQSRGLGRLLAQSLQARPDVVDAAGDLNIKISGCPNGCGQHHVAGLGFQGSVRRLGARVLPQYFVMVGGGVGPNGAQFGRLAAKIPARRVPQAVERLVGLYREQRAAGEGATAFFQRVELAAVKAALGDLDKMTAQDATEVDYVDLGEAAAFSVTAMEGECSA
jgi:sulfite reductase beta subunit-like hemoprotein